VEKDSEKEIKKAGMRVKADCDALVLLATKPISWQLKTINAVNAELQ